MIELTLRAVTMIRHYSIPDSAVQYWPTVGAKTKLDLGMRVSWFWLRAFLDSGKNRRGRDLDNAE